ncbi:hypothetical protein [Sphingomonas sp.]|uniref:hypothetical protein n=1 Tax=Sphingomonas sp. TaxID=28214 RepID=UPI003B3BE26B
MNSFLSRYGLAAILIVAQPAWSQAEQPAKTDRFGQTTKTAGRIASQPARDVGASKTNIPPVLQKAIQSPYSLTGLRTCAQLRAATKELTAVLGPDFVAGAVTNENRASKIAEAGGRTVVNAIIPFRGLVREVSGAAPAQRRLNAAIDAGYARRGFLRGVATQRKCRLG